MFLSEMQIGQKQIVLKFNKETIDSKRLRHLGLTEGTVVELVRVAPLSDPLEIKLRGFYLSLRIVQAKNILVGDYE